MSKRVVLFLFTLVFLTSISLYTEAALNPPGNWIITSDYGPRNLDSSPFHKGIDYGGGYGDPVNAVEGGSIDRIDYRIRIRICCAS